jgi:hypothetical protein
MKNMDLESLREFYNKTFMNEIFTNRVPCFDALTQEELIFLSNTISYAIFKFKKATGAFEKELIKYQQSQKEKFAYLSKKLSNGSRKSAASMKNIEEMRNRFKKLYKK